MVFEDRLTLEQIESFLLNNSGSECDSDSENEDDSIRDVKQAADKEK
jgi:hypothetical protein